MIILEQHRAALHWTRIAEVMTPSSAQVASAMDAMSRSFELQGRTVVDAHGLALAQIGRLAGQQVSYLSTIDGFVVVGVAVCGGLFAAWQRRIK